MEKLYSVVWLEGMLAHFISFQLPIFGFDTSIFYWTWFRFKIRISVCMLSCSTTTSTRIHMHKTNGWPPLPPSPTSLIIIILITDRLFLNIKDFQKVEETDLTAPLPQPPHWIWPPPHTHTMWQGLSAFIGAPLAGRHTHTHTHTHGLINERVSKSLMSTTSLHLSRGIHWVMIKGQ